MQQLDLLQREAQQAPVHPLPPQTFLNLQAYAKSVSIDTSTLA